MRRWSTDFHPEHTKVDRTLVWVRFPGLNLLWYDESFLRAMAAVIGTPVRVDRNTLGVARGRFARVCVEIELQKPVIGKIWVHGHWCKVEYEGLHYICAGCGCYGHLVRTAPNRLLQLRGRRFRIQLQVRVQGRREQTRKQLNLRRKIRGMRKARR